MKKCKVKYTETAHKHLCALGAQTTRRIKKYLDEHIATEENPRRFGEVLKANLAGLWKYRIGDYRVIADIQDDEVIVLVLVV